MAMPPLTPGSASRSKTATQRLRLRVGRRALNVKSLPGTPTPLAEPRAPGWNDLELLFGDYAAKVPDRGP